MNRFLTTVFLLIFSLGNSWAQSSLKINEFMEGYDYIGHSPEYVRWSDNSQQIYFNWNPEKATSDSTYVWGLKKKQYKKIGFLANQKLEAGNGVYSKDRKRKVYVHQGNIYLKDIRKGTAKRLTQTQDYFSSVRFSWDEKAIVYRFKMNLYSIDLKTGLISQLTDFRSGKKSKGKSLSAQDEWIKADELTLIQEFQKKKEKERLRKANNKRLPKDAPLPIYLGKASVSSVSISADGNFVVYRMYESVSNKGTLVPSYVRESGYTKDLNARPNVGTKPASLKIGIYDVKNRKTYEVPTDQLEGIKKQPDYYQEYEKLKDKEPIVRTVYANGPVWSNDGKRVLVVFRSVDNKDRWITEIDLKTGEPQLIDHQRDEAWIAGPGIGWDYSTGELGWLADNQTVWFQSEASGYSHLHSYNSQTSEKKQLTAGAFEVYNPLLSKDKSKWYFTSNEGNSGIRHFYSMPVGGGVRTKITTLDGRNEVTMSPDEKYLAVMYSNSNTPTELYWMKNKPQASMQKITDSQSKAFRQYEWRKPEIVKFKASDGEEVTARLYKPKASVNKNKAVIFVHGAGYLQNAHEWWSTYYHEYMFHNFLLDNGYTVFDIDYRGSAGYGRDWRTGIYRHMGGKDLSDQVDGAKFLVENYGIHSEKIGIYGGSYGGFITLMALFQNSETFATGAALRSVTDWAHYNHGYTSNILNTPVLDSLAYRKSSPIYYAEGLEKPLLICHGMIDTNVHFQDVVRLSQRLIELRKENWEMAVYPLEGHGFRTGTSWADEYRRIFKLFEKHL